MYARHHGHTTLRGTWPCTALEIVEHEPFNLISKDGSDSLVVLHDALQSKEFGIQGQDSAATQCDSTKASVVNDVADTDALHYYMYGTRRSAVNLHRSNAYTRTHGQQTMHSGPCDSIADRTGTDSRNTPQDLTMSRVNGCVVQGGQRHSAETEISGDNELLNATSKELSGGSLKSVAGDRMAGNGKTEGDCEDIRGMRSGLDGRDESDVRTALDV